MPVVHARIRVEADGTISGRAPQDIPPGEYEAPIEVVEPKCRIKRKCFDLPLHNEYWDDSVSLRREDVYRGTPRLL